jgi:hypothetical protein
MKDNKLLLMFYNLLVTIATIYKDKILSVPFIKPVYLYIYRLNLKSYITWLDIESAITVSTQEPSIYELNASSKHSNVFLYIVNQRFNYLFDDSAQERIITLKSYIFLKLYRSRCTEQIREYR